MQIDNYLATEKQLGKILVNLERIKTSVLSQDGSSLDPELVSRVLEALASNRFEDISDIVEKKKEEEHR